MNKVFIDKFTIINLFARAKRLVNDADTSEEYANGYIAALYDSCIREYTSNYVKIRPRKVEKQKYDTKERRAEGLDFVYLLEITNLITGRKRKFPVYIDDPGQQLCIKYGKSYYSGGTYNSNLGDLVFSVNYFSYLAWRSHINLNKNKEKK